MRRIFHFLGLPAVALLATVLLFNPGHALAFSANNVMDDGVFDRVNSTSAGQIDSWINANFPSSCISTNNGFSAPEPVGYSLATGFKYAGNVSSGQVIYDAAQAYGINPHVLIVTLQKEQSLVTGSSGCSTLRYAAAAGYGCPDGGTTYTYNNISLYAINNVMVTTVTGTCVNSAAKAGFSQQVIRAAWLLKFGEQRSEGNVGWAVIKGNWDNSDDPPTTYSGPMTQGNRARVSGGAVSYYDGYTVIDGVSTHIDTGATAALYWYTPHTAGNQSFVTLFNSWFGEVHDIYTWQPAGQAAYTDQTKTTAVDLIKLPPGQRVYLRFQARNTGDTVWYNTGAYPIRVGTGGPIDRCSIFYDPTWFGCNRVVNMIESSVDPGGIATFEFWYQAPNSAYSGFEQFRVMAEALSWMNDPQMSFWTIVKPTYTWAVAGQSAFTDQTETTAVDLITLRPGQRVYLEFQARNTGNMTWLNTGANAVRVGTGGPIDRCSVFYDPSWFGCNRVVNMIEPSVAPGGTATFKFWYQVPNSPNFTYSGFEQFRVMAEALTWMNDPQMSFWTIVKPTYTWAVAGQVAYTDSTETVPVDLITLTPHQRVYVEFQARNTGNMTWLNTGANAVRVGTGGPIDRCSVFYDPSWFGCNRVVNMIEPSVAPGQIATFKFWYQAPAAYSGFEQFRVMAEALTWMNDPQMSFWTIVK